MIKTSFCRETGDFAISWPGRVARHDLVYKAPPADPMQYGMPVGNGDIGALLWCDDRRVYIALNKCDLWDDAPFGRFCNWKRSEEEFSTTLRHACRIVIDFGMPVFDPFYLKDFTARLRLKDGCIEMELVSAFGRMRLEMFVTSEGSVLCFRAETDFEEDAGVEITLERYGSRTFSHWYRFFRRDPMLGLTGTDAWTENDCLLIRHTLTTGDFVCALRPEGEGLNAARRTSHTACARAEKCPKAFSFFAAVTSPFDEDASAAHALKILSDAAAKGFDALLAESEAFWKAFWSRSFIETDDDYLDNLWHLAMYYSCAGQRGRYPGRFINSLWNWNRDVQPWNFYFHWNQQEVYWGLNAAGHHDLCESYLNYRFNAMEVSREDAMRLFGVENGLFVSDVCERRGYNSDGEMDNHTPVGEVALDFWRQYRYTGDRIFLLNKALPYLQGAARFFKTLFVKEADGLYHARCGNAYEGWELFYDSVTELAMAKALFTALLDALREAGVSDPDEEEYREIMEHLAPIRLLDIDPRIANGGVIQRGLYKGRPVQSEKVLALGRLLEQGADQQHKPLAGQYVPQYMPSENTQADPLNGMDVVRSMLYRHSIPAGVQDEVYSDYGAHPQANVAPVYPMSVIGLKDRGSELFNAAVTTALTSRNGQMMGWDPMPIVLARLGLADELDRLMETYPTVWQYYNNGFGHYGPDSVMLADKTSPFRRDIVTDVNNDSDTFYAETYPFRHMGLEPMGVFSAAMNERLLQSHEGVIRIAPAYSKRSARFRLHAAGGFIVMCEIAEGAPVLAAVRSLRGGCLRLENPWDVAWLNGEAHAERIIELNAEPGGLYLFTPEKDPDLDFTPETPAPNADCKIWRDKCAMLGLARSF